MPGCGPYCRFKVLKISYVQSYRAPSLSPCQPLSLGREAQQKRARLSKPSGTLSLAEQSPALERGRQESPGGANERPVFSSAMENPTPGRFLPAGAGRPPGRTFRPWAGGETGSEKERGRRAGPSVPIPGLALARASAAVAGRRSLPPGSSPGGRRRAPAAPGLRFA